jgi:sugar (pentulose or hexulose) kinase
MIGAAAAGLRRGEGDATFFAVDLGASSGRVLAARVGPGRLDAVEAYRFANQPLRLPTGLHWDVTHLYAEVLRGIAAAVRLGEQPRSIGVDSWAVDYGLLDADGALLGIPYHYRDTRTAGVADKVHAEVSAADLYLANGLQFLPFTTLYQLAAAAGSRQVAEAASGGTLLLIPDLIGYWLTGRKVSEVTNASTTGLLDVRNRRWSTPLTRAAGIRPELLPPLVGPGAVVGPVRSDVASETGIAPGTPVTAVGSHDTASAIVGVPAVGDGWAYISCGTWSLVGVELAAPVLTERSRLAGFTNEAGVDGRVRYLHNVMGLWILQECLRTWRRADPPAVDDLLAAAAALPAGGPAVDPDAPVFLPPGDMPARLADACRASGLPVPDTQAGMVRCVLDSLAAAYARTIRAAAELSGQDVNVVHIVGGGARNALLCQLTADACELPVLAGPAEATALGNVLVQARAHGVLRGGLDALRSLVRATQPPRLHEPRRRRGQEPRGRKVR